MLNFETFYSFQKVGTNYTYSSSRRTYKYSLGSPRALLKTTLGKDSISP
jgi:hypothetical protein